MLDKIDESMDRRLAKHLVGLYLEDKPESGTLDILVRRLCVCTPALRCARES